MLKLTSTWGRRASQQLVVSLLSRNGSNLVRVGSTRYYSQVAAQVSRRRPMVRGEAVAFHVKDLESVRRRPLVHQAAATAYADEEDDDYTSEAELGTHRAYDSDLIVVLDMDECLIHSQFLTSNPAAKFYAHQVARNSSDASTSGRVDSFQFHLPDGDLVHVNKRPHLEDFLQAVTSRYETHIYTAAMKVYAEPILDKLDPHGTRFAQRWYRESCELDSQMGAYVKNLGKLRLQPKGDAPSFTYQSSVQQQQKATAHQAEPLRRVVLVDNNPLSFLANPTNGILVSSFYNDPADKTLPAVLELLEELEPLEDVRPTLDARFGLKAALSEIQGSRRQKQTWKTPT